MQAAVAGGKGISLGGLKGALAGSKLLITLGSFSITASLSVVLIVASLGSWLAHQQPSVSGVGASAIAQAALTLEGHLYGARTTLYNMNDPYMVKVEGYWKTYCSNADGSLCTLASPGGLQCVQFVTASYWLAGDPLPSIHDAIDFWSAYNGLPNWQRIPSPSSANVAFLPPQPGDLIIWQGGTFGHIAVVVSYQSPRGTKNGTVEVAQANAPGNRYSDPTHDGNTYSMTVHADGRIDTWPGFSVVGFLRHLKAPTITIQAGTKVTLGVSLGNPLVKYAWDAAQRAGIPQDVFVRQIASESSFNPNAVSPTGAEGIAQFMPDTAAGIANPLGSGSLDPFEPHQALVAAAQYMAAKAATYGGDYAKALAAYNCGDGGVQSAVNRALAAGNANAWRTYLPQETQNYLDRILGP